MKYLTGIVDCWCNVPLQRPPHVLTTRVSSHFMLVQHAQFGRLNVHLVELLNLHIQNSIQRQNVLDIRLSLHKSFQRSMLQM